MGSRIDSPGQPAVDREAGVGELVAELLRRLGRVVAGLPGADDPDAMLMVALLDAPQDIQNDRRIMDLSEQ